MKNLFILFIYFFIMSNVNVVFANNNLYNEKIYGEQYKASGANKLFDALPNETKKFFEKFEIKNPDIKKIMDISPENIFQNLINLVKERVPGSIASIGLILAVIFLNSIFSAIKPSTGEKSISVILNIVSTLCICVTIINPIISFIGRASGVIRGAANFLFCYIPIMVGVMVASGQAISSVAFSTTMFSLGEMIVQIFSKCLVPALNIFFALSIVNAISPKYNFSSLCELISRAMKWIICSLMSIFSSILTIKSLIGSSLDSVSNKTIKFALTSFVPIVGSAIGDAFATVQGCVKILKSGVGAFFILAVGFIFVPIIVECIIWSLSTNLCIAIGDIFELSSITFLLKSINKVINIINAMILCIMIILIISTVIILSISNI